MTVLEVFADVTCPFTHVGLRRFLEARTAHGRPDIALWVRAWPLEIVNGEPVAPDFIASEVGDLRRQVAPDLFAGFSAESFPTSSLPALALARAAYDVDLATGEAVSLALRDLLFEVGVDIGDPVELTRLADRHGVHADLGATERVLAEHAEGRRRGVVGSPHFFTPGGDFFCPALSIERDPAGHLQIAVDEDRFAEFLSGCFT